MYTYSSPFFSLVHYLHTIDLQKCFSVNTSKNLVSTKVKHFTKC